MKCIITSVLASSVLLATHAFAAGESLVLAVKSIKVSSGSLTVVLSDSVTLRTSDDEIINNYGKARLQIRGGIAPECTLFASQSAISGAKFHVYINPASFSYEEGRDLGTLSANANHIEFCGLR